ncbi:MAG TPA: hypothetical protein VN285_03020 [Candidatus Deferrimicrobium sp.]|nr:hypothetical protein [Candidatus Deferrimicrobium sp.]
MIVELEKIRMSLDTSILTLSFLPMTDSLWRTWGANIVDPRGRCVADTADQRALGITIYICDGLPLAAAIQALAHESAHAFRYQHALFGGDSAFVEQGCNYAAYRVLSSLGGRCAKLLRSAISSRTIGRWTGMEITQVEAFVKEHRRHGLDKWIELFSKADQWP